ncbi:conserved hypothetical protein [Talaromyces stipitatus ATCC 10500]|uniref:Zona occludens toxin N-terminal domain-containing protein n=1 Tax=Talaromyces stipitatus (strain ATCC 10500 / CBS 375.48 / QM 6759 / NRRL 1006) TaxID=441959 RepID=B8MV41_TALSN|nr:uncharacterized protein TSTA_109360 [Talaromyces stipitatus ATCC 10500]EED11757.1 conserved hypothetical protein [Talaromyces stipitatus ATCC 10500]
MPETQTTHQINKKTGRQKKRIGQAKGTMWKPKTACALFNICLGIFLEQDPAVGRVVALDEAHKYMNSSPESAAFTNSLLSTVRLQRHLGARVIVSTQEPTVSTALLNLCSTTIVHRFTSPEWLRILHRHLAAAAYDSQHDERVFAGAMDDDADAADSDTLFHRIVRLQVGEALLFSPTAMVISQDSEGQEPTFCYLGDKYVTIKIRARVTEDGGKSVLSS